MAQLVELLTGDGSDIKFKTWHIGPVSPYLPEGKYVVPGRYAWYRFNL